MEKIRMNEAVIANEIMDDEINEIFEAECCSCGAIFNEDDAIICEHCGATLCPDCACFDDELWSYFCEDCYDEIVEERELKNCVYGYHEGPRLDPVQTRREVRCGIPFKGVGLETEIVGHGDYRILPQVAEILGENVIFERDCTVEVEMVSAPFSLEYFASIKDDYRRAFSMLEDAGFYTNSHCGAHVHFSRECFGDTEAQQDETIAKILAFYSLFSKALVEFSGRADLCYCESLSGSVKAYKNGRKERGHYVAVNCENDATIEFRLLQGTLNFDKVYGWIMFHNALIERAKNIPWERINNAGAWTVTMPFDGVPYETYNAFVNSVKNNGGMYAELHCYRPMILGANGNEISVLPTSIFDNEREAIRQAESIAYAFGNGSFDYRLVRIGSTDDRLDRAWIIQRMDGQKIAEIIVKKLPYDFGN